MPLLTGAAGHEPDALGAVPPWVVPMVDVWNAAKRRYPGASIASMCGLNADRVARPLDGHAVPRPSEAMALDGALQTNAMQYMPKVDHTHIPRPLIDKPTRADRTMRKTHAMTPSREARAAAWEPLVEKSRKTLAAIAVETGIGPNRLHRVLRGGAIVEAWEREKLLAALGVTEMP